LYSGVKCMRNNKGQFLKGQPSENPDGLKLGHGWNKGKKGWTNKGSFSKGHEVLEEWKDVTRKINKGNTYRRGSKHTEESKKKMSDSLKGRVGLRGEKASNWKGGITPERKRLYFTPEYRLWRKSVFERDAYTCIFCGKKGGELNADHIKPWCDYPELRFAIDNGRTLCVECHRKTDTWGTHK